MSSGEAKKIQRRRAIGLWIFIMGFFITQLLVSAWSRVQCIRIGYDISAETEKQKALYDVQKNLRIELERLKSPQRIEKIAREHLGLFSPAPDQIVTIR